MANKFYDSGRERASKVKDLFGKIAPRYDLINDLQSFGLHRSWKRALLRLAAPQAGESALDLCCGTGDLALALAAQGVHTIGLDFSAPMLTVAKNRAANLELVRFVRADAEHVPFAENSFDLVTVGYGLRNLADWKRGLREMWRVAKPGGRLLLLDFGKPENPLWRALYFAYLRCVVPFFGILFCGDADTYGYILRSLKAYPAQEVVAQELRSLSCAEVRVVTFLGGIMSIHFARKQEAVGQVLV